MKITCKELAQEVKDNVRLKISGTGFVPRFLIVSVGDDPASASYVRGKIRDCEEVGIKVFHLKLDADCTQENLEYVLTTYGYETDAVILQLPLPKHLDADRAIECIPLEKDVDGLRLGSYYKPCTALGIYELLKRNVDLQGKHAVIINRSKLVGRPLAKLLLDADATVTVCHSKTRDIAMHTLSADIVVTAVGQPNFLDWNDVMSGAIVVDVGINRVDGKLCGDYSPTYDEDLYNIEYTPVPGGVGLLTRAYLMQNVMDACMRARNIEYVR